MSKIADAVSEIARPIVEENGCSLYKVKYLKEGPNYYLRVFIDKESGIGIDDCEVISRALDPILDEHTEIFPNPYVFEVSSSGEEKEHDAKIEKGV